MSGMLREAAPISKCRSSQDARISGMHSPARSKAGARWRRPRLRRRYAARMHQLLQRRQIAMLFSPALVATWPAILATGLLAADALVVPAINPVRAAPMSSARIVGNSVDLLDIHFSLDSS